MRGRVLLSGSGGVLVFLALMSIVGCTTKIVGDRISNDAEIHGWSWKAKVSPPKDIFTVQDEKVTYTVWFKTAPGDWEEYHVTWVAPGGAIYRTDPLSIKNGFSDHVGIATLPIRDNFPSRLPGEWHLRLYRKESLLWEKKFLIEDPSGKYSPPARGGGGQEAASTNEEAR
jgi:hypothetical protein